MSDRDEPIDEDDQGGYEDEWHEPDDDTLDD